MNRKIIIIASLIIIGVVVWQVASRFNNSKNIVDKIEQKTGAASTITVPSKPSKCTLELVQADCEKFEKKTVCGYDHTIYESGKEKDNALQFKSACHYCKFYGLEEKEIAGTRIKGLGYENKPCDQGMYRKSN